LKQGQYRPMPVEQQIMIIFAVTNGFIDDVPVNQVREWERGFHEFMAKTYPNIGDGLRTGKVLTKELEADLRRGIEAFKTGPGAPKTSAPRVEDAVK
jgi:F-type H+-transporting ATPase subunit alpha